MKTELIAFLFMVYGGILSGQSNSNSIDNKFPYNIHYRTNNVVNITSKQIKEKLPFNISYRLDTVDDKFIDYFKSEAKKEIRAFGVMGGCLSPKSFYNYKDLDIPIYFDGKIVTTPSTSKLEEDLALATERILDKNLKVKAKILEDKVIYTINNKKVNIDSSLGKLHRIANEITTRAKNNPKFIDIYALINSGVKITERHIKDAFYLYILEDKDDYFLFGIKYQP